MKPVGISTYSNDTSPMNFSNNEWIKQNLEKRTLLSFLAIRIYFEEDIWKISNTACSKTPTPKEVNSELFHKAVELIFNSLCGTTEPRLDCV